jgi:hypothetical protein
MAKRLATSGPYQDTTPRKAACAILWLRMINCRFFPEPPPCWALRDPQEIGLSESTSIAFDDRDHSRAEQMVNQLAEVQCWKRRDGEDLPIRIFDGITLGKVLDNFFDR